MRSDGWKTGAGGTAVTGTVSVPVGADDDSSETRLFEVIGTFEMAATNLVLASSADPQNGALRAVARIAQAASIAHALALVGNHEAAQWLQDTERKAHDLLVSVWKDGHEKLSDSPLLHVVPATRAGMNEELGA
jgi:hypothetical protein